MEFFDKDFDPAKAKAACSEWVRKFFDENGPGCNAVIGISGGKDSSVTAAICCDALGPERVVGVMMPNGPMPHDEITEKLISFLGIKTYVIDISGSYGSIMDELGAKLDADISEQTRINLPPRLRMSALYAVSQSMNGRVANTGNLSEDWVGYSTRYGDSAGDFSPLSRFVVQEVRAIGLELGLPPEIVERVPDDGLSGMSDEEKLGFTYDTLDRYIRTGEIDDPADKERIDRLHKQNLFKLRMMPAFEHGGPVRA